MNAVVSWLKHVFLVAVAFVSLYPFYWVVVNSLKTTSAIYVNSNGLPLPLYLHNYVHVLRDAGLGRSLINSTIATASSVGATLIMGIAIAYVLARVWRRGIGLGYFIVGLMIPGQAIIVPVFILVKMIGLDDSIAGLVLVYTAGGMPLCVFLLYTYVKAIPKELEEATFMDGGSRTRVFVSVIVPLSRAGLATVGIITFLFNWNEFFYAYMLLPDRLKWMLTEAVYALRGMYKTDYAAVFAGLTVMMLPIIVLYVFSQELVTKGMIAGAVKE